MSDYNSDMFHNIYFSQHRSWSRFPKRNQSIICTTTIDDAKDFGAVYIVLPYDNTIWGVCPQNDIWGSFEDIFDIYNNKHQINKLSTQIKQIYNNARENIRNIDFILNISDEELQEFAQDTLIYEYYKENYRTHNSFGLMLQELLDPNNNQFTITSNIKTITTSKEPKEV